MPELFQKQYRVETSRLPDWDYSTPGNYFVTLCTQNRKSYFGSIEDGKMCLNQVGKIVKEEILKTEQIRKNIIVDSWVVMPNHVHLIIFITDRDRVETPRRGVSTETINHWKPGSLGVIINHLKGACTRRIRTNISPHFAWQSRFYDHIIRTEQDLANLRLYIESNPSNWLNDRSEIIPIEVVTHA